MRRQPPGSIGRSKSALSRRFAMYFLGLAIGLVLVGLLQSLKQIALQDRQPPAPAERATDR